MANLSESQMKISYAERFELDAHAYAGVSVLAVPFSVRVANLFSHNKILTIEDLLNKTPQSMMELRGFGKLCFEEIEKFCKGLHSEKSVPYLEETAVASASEVSSVTCKKYREAMVWGDFSFADDPLLPMETKETVNRYRDAYECLGEELVFDCVTSPEKTLPIMRMFSEFHEKSQLEHDFLNRIKCIPAERRKKRAIPYIRAFTMDESKRTVLMGLCKDEATTILEMVSNLTPKQQDATVLLEKFYSWCSFDLLSEIEGVFAKIFSKENYKIVIQGRAQNQTLEYVGRVIGVTRERIRQIENKVKKRFAWYQSRIRIISKISAERNGDQVLTPYEIEQYCGDYAQELLFLLQSYESPNYTYDKQLDLFILGNNSLSEQVNQYIESLPDYVHEDRLPVIIRTASEDAELPTEMVEKAFLDAYRLTGATYHRARLSLAVIYQQVIRKYYPHGIHVYDAEEIAHFRDIIRAEYGDVSLPQNDRAMSARIAGICILCDRGVYKLKQKKYISDELASRIHRYIVHGDSPIYMTNTLFSVFEDELSAEGVTNKYYLHGILHELFGEEFVFRRDYISRDPGATSMYSAIVEFIRRSPYPVEKKLIQKEFPGITEIVIHFAVSDANILNYFGEYLHASRLRLSEGDIEYLHDVANRFLEDKQAHHIKELYEEVIRKRPEILSRNAVSIYFSFYSIMEYLFEKDFQFSRPYIAPEGIEIGRPAERLHDLIYSSDEFDISGISSFARENHYQIQSLLEFINSCNDEYLLINATTMMRISTVGISEKTAKQIDSIVAEDLDCTMPINELTIWHKLPKLCIPWTDWLLYSVLKKWGKDTTVSTSSNQFKLAVPLIAPAGEMDESKFFNLVSSGQSGTLQIDNLDDIDTLLGDILDDEAIWEETI